MLLLVLWFFWYFYDDHLAEWLNAPAVGDVSGFWWFIILGVLFWRAVLK